MSSLQDFFNSIADEMNRPRDSMNPIVKIFEENWYDSVESIKGLDEEALTKMKIPMRLVEIIHKKLHGNKETAQPQVQAQPVQKMEEEKKFDEPTAEDKSLTKHLISRVNMCLEQLKRETIRSQVFIETCGILEKVTSNIIKDPKNETFRTLNLLNPKLQEKLFAYRSVNDVLDIIGFVRKENTLHLQEKDVNSSLISGTVKEISAFVKKAQETQAFDPYKSSFSSLGDVNVNNIVNQGGSTNYDWGQQLEELKQKRFNAVKPYIQAKDPKVFVLKPEQSIQSFISTRDEGVEENSDDALFKKEILRWAKQFQETQNFTSRRRKEFEALLKEPLFTESMIRVKFPNNYVFEAKFSPKEPVKNIVELVKQHLVDPNWDFYLFQTPPVQKITHQNWNKSLEEAELVPNALLYFGFNTDVKDPQNYLTLKPLNA